MKRGRKRTPLSDLVHCKNFYTMNPIRYTIGWVRTVVIPKLLY